MNHVLSPFSTSDSVRESLVPLLQMDKIQRNQNGTYTGSSNSLWNNLYISSGAPFKAAI